MSGNDLKRKVGDLKEGNEVMALAIQRTRLSVKRLKLEYSVLLERLESRVELDPELRYENTLPTLESFKKELLTKPLKKSKSKRQKAKDRDPNMPKRPTNAYLLFCEMNKEKIREGGSQDVSKDLTEAWKNLNEEDRKPYYKLYSEDRERYQKEMEIYSTKMGHPRANDEEEDGETTTAGAKPTGEDEEEEEEEEDGEEEDEEDDEREPESEVTQLEEEEDDEEQEEEEEEEEEEEDDDEQEEDDDDDIGDVPTSEA